jgi:hypothetical protein
MKNISGLIVVFILFNVIAIQLVSANVGQFGGFGFHRP